ncbi:hypothetical protein MNBD_DELTA01-595 [hydrothermal vent metagenome]|uniref:Membrane-fusion protein n=1 Tax=hydrothermal vent metagenome TaxID=652676 RepID=A0A3B0QUI6_9ZZZZ
MTEEDNSISIVNLGKLSKPADTLIKKVSSAVGGVFEPWQIKRVAKANAEADLIKANSEIEITDLQRRAMHRFVEEEASRQQNMEDITEKAIPKLDADSNPSEMEDDWVTNFFDKSRIVSDEEMQKLWSSVLAGEANAPGTYSKRTVNLLGDLDKKDAELFQTLCRFGFNTGKFSPFIFSVEDQIYNNLGLNFNTLSHLDSIGLIKFEHIAGFVRTSLPKTFTLSYFNRPLTLTMKGDTDNKLPTGKVLLTKVGEELATVCPVSRVDGFEDYVREKWATYLPKNKTMQVTINNAPDL